MRTLFAAAGVVRLSATAAADMMSSAVDCLVSVETLRTLRPAPDATIRRGFEKADRYIMNRFSDDLAATIAVRMNAVLEAVAAAPKDQAARGLAEVADRACKEVWNGEP